MRKWNFTIEQVIDIAQEAGRAIMEVYLNEDVGTVLKTDESPLTLADTQSHDIIVRSLEDLTPDYPVLSEESQAIDYHIRKSWSTFWLVDPLDGTKEFIKRNGEFTVNMALIQNGMPILGIVHAPVLEVTYYAAIDKGAYKMNGHTEVQKIAVNKNMQEKLKIVVSRSHNDEKTEAFLEKMGPCESVSVGSSLKFCYVAEGKAHVYPRFGPTMEWDTAAAQCVAEQAGALVTNLAGEPLTYNKENLLNPYFIVSALPLDSWKKY